MPSSPRRIAANQANSQKSTGPKTAEGKEVSRANAVTHGLSCLVVVPGEEAGARRRPHRAELQEDPRTRGRPAHPHPRPPGGLPLAVQGERAFRYLTAMAADRARNAETELRRACARTAADQLFQLPLASEPVTKHRRLMGTARGSATSSSASWRNSAGSGQPGGASVGGFGHATLAGPVHRPLGYGAHLPMSRGQALSDVIVYDRVTGLDATEVPGGRPPRPRLPGLKVSCTS